MFAGRLATTTTNASAAGEYKGRVLIVTFFSAKRLDPLYDFSTHTHIQKEKQIPRPVERLKKLLKNGFFFFFLLLSLKSFQMMRDWIIQGICDISPPSTYILYGDFHPEKKEDAMIIYFQLVVTSRMLCGKKK